MRKLFVFTLLTMSALTGVASTKESGKSTLKDVQPAGTTEKNHKHLQYDLSFVTDSGTDYTCRTKEKSNINATDYAVGTDITYEVNGNKGKVKTAAGKKADCTIVRVAKASTTPK